ncbi:MAG: DUF4157 domain-containing protein [Crocinitomicaceae bacterium]|nr:DUF4157 domain-containing protein [Crocinitomicaceae bacterium]
MQSAKTNKPANKYASNQHANTPFITPSATQIAKKASENESESSTSEAVQAKTPYFGKPPLFNPSNTVQAKLNMGKPNDKFEKEADHMADKVVAQTSSPEITPTPAPPIQTSKVGAGDLQRMESPATEESELQAKEENEQDVQLMSDEENDVQMMDDEDSSIQKMEDDEVQAMDDEDSSVQKMEDEEVQAMDYEDSSVQKMEEEKVQQQTSNANETNLLSSIESRLKSSKGGGTPLSQDILRKMESSFGVDFSDVRVHTGTNAILMNQQLGSHAFTNGNDIYFNTGKYNPSSKDGLHLLAHELTHTVQQGASSEPMVQREEPATTTETTGSETTEAVPEEVKVKTAKDGTQKPSTAIDITHRFKVNSEWTKYLDALHADGENKFDVDVKIGERYSGTIKVKRKGKAEEGKPTQYQLASTSRDHYLDVNGWNIFDPLRTEEIYPVLALKQFGEAQETIGFFTVRLGEKAPKSSPKEFLDQLNKNLEAMSFLGVDKLKATGAHIENTFESGSLTFNISSIKTEIDGYLEAEGGMGITGDAFTFDLDATVNIAGLAEGHVNIELGEDGKLQGAGDINADIANVNANIHVEYIDGVVSIEGKGSINSEKFSGEITLVVTDHQRSKDLMDAALGVDSMEEEEKTIAEPKEKKKGNQVLAGWGTVTTNITPWLSGEASVGIDSEGHVTIVGEINVDDEIELMEERGKKIDIFKVEIRGGFGIPLVGQVFLFASIGMFMNAGFGPLVLKDVSLAGTYSTDSTKLRNFTITGTLGINAFAILGLEAEAGVGLTLIGHTVKAGVNLTAAAGIRAYAEATPTFEYIEKATPEGGKVGESHLKGHFEAAAQLFLQLSGALFFSLDSPWWSPVPEGRTEYPFGNVQYPIGPSMGIGADIDWLVGSPEAPELEFSPVEFNADKFTKDVMADPPDKKRGDSDADPEGEWVDAPGSDQETDPELKDGEGLKDGKKEDISKLNAEERYMRALDEMSTLEKARPKPTMSVVRAKAKKVRKKYKVDKINVWKSDGKAYVIVIHKSKNNKKHIMKIKLMTEAERNKLITKASKDLNTRSKKATGKDGTIEKSKAIEILKAIKKKHKVIDSAQIKDGGTTWDYLLDFIDKDKLVKGQTKKPEKVTDKKVDGEKKKDLPKTVVTPSMSNGRAHKVKAFPLTKYSGNTEGSPPSKNPEGWNDSVRTENWKWWVRAHLLSEALHGPGLKWNLTIGTKETNSAMYSEAEKRAINFVQNDSILYYEVAVSYHSNKGYENFPKQIKVDWGKLKGEKGNYTKDKNLGRSFNQDLPPATKTEKVSLSESSSSRLTEVANKAGQERLGAFFKEVVIARRDLNDHRFLDLSHINKVMNAHYEAKGKGKGYFSKTYRAKLASLIPDKIAFTNN